MGTSKQKEKESFSLQIHQKEGDEAGHHTPNGMKMNEINKTNGPMKCIRVNKYAMLEIIILAPNTCI